MVMVTSMGIEGASLVRPKALIVDILALKVDSYHKDNRRHCISLLPLWWMASVRRAKSHRLRFIKTNAIILSSKVEVGALCQPFFDSPSVADVAMHDYMPTS